MKTEHIQLATALTILAIVVGTVVFYFSQQSVYAQKLSDVKDQVKTESLVRENADVTQTILINRSLAAMAVYNKNQIKMCQRLQVDCDPIQP